MSPESLPTSPEQTQQPILAQEQADFAMQQLGIPRDKLDELIKNPEFQKDLKILQDNPGNTTEQGKFLQKYLPTVDKKDGGQILRKTDGSIDFGNWMKGKTPEERKQMAKGLTDSEYDSYLEWKKSDNEGKKATIVSEDRSNEGKKATIVSEDRSNEGKKATISEQFEKCTEQEVQLKKSLSEEGKLALKGDIASIKNNPGSPEYQELILKGVTEEQIKSGKADSMITALYTYNNQAKFLEKGWVEKGKEADFQKTVDNFSDILGKDRKIPAVRDFIEKGLISGERKEMVLQGVDKLVSSGKYNLSQTTYNAETGMITFRSIRDGESAHINTSHIPPTLEYTRGGLRIGREIQSITPEERTRKEKTAELTDSRKKTESAEQNYKNLTGTPDSLKAFAEFGEQNKDNTTISASLQMRQTLMKEYTTGDTAKKLEITNKLIGNNKDLNKQRLDLIRLDKPIVEGMEKAVELEGFTLHNLQESLKQEIKTEQELKAIAPNVPKLKDDGFESTAQYNLNFLSKIGYDGIGQDNMERIIRTLNSSQNPSRSSVGEIDLNQKLDTPKTQALTLAIANLVRNGRISTSEQSEEQQKQEQSQKSYDNVDKSDPYIAARQTQSLGFRESLSSVARNMSQEGGSLKTDTAMKKVLFGTTESTEVKLPEANSAILKVPTTLA